MWTQDDADNNQQEFSNNPQDLAKAAGYDAALEALVEFLAEWPDPKSATTLENIVAFVRSLQPPPRDEELARTEDSNNGQAVFHRLGCALCHIVSMMTLPKTRDRQADG